MSESTHEVSQLLASWQRGDQGALELLLPLVYDELRKIAHHHLRGQGRIPTLESRVLVHELYLKIPRLANLHWQGRTHFLCVMSHLMRQVLIDQARKRRARKREGVFLSLDEGMASAKQPALNLTDLDHALRRLETFDPELNQLVELRFFGGLSIEETAEALEISPATVKRRWATAKAWLSREISR